MNDENKIDFNNQGAFDTALKKLWQNRKIPINLHDISKVGNVPYKELTNDLDKQIVDNYIYELKKAGIEDEVLHHASHYYPKYYFCFNYNNTKFYATFPDDLNNKLYSIYSKAHD